MRLRRNDPGFSLIETVIAIGLLATALVALAQLFADATRTVVGTRRVTYATVLAEQKVEELKGGHVGVSPETSLGTNTPGFVDHLDQSGRVVGAGPQPPPEARYTRRWSVAPLSGDAPEAVVVQVSVVASDLVVHPEPGVRLPEEVRIVAVVRPR